MPAMIDIYAGRSPLDVPAYPLRDVASWLRLPYATLRTWTFGRHYPSSSGLKRSEPLIRMPDRNVAAVSFSNLIELHVLSAIRRVHRVEMAAVRKALKYLSRQRHVERPLVDLNLLTDGTDLFVEQYGRLLNVSRNGQQEIKQAVETYLRRIERLPDGQIKRFFPFTRLATENAPTDVQLDPRLQFGRPCIVGTGITTAIVAERYRAGDSIELLAKDYGQAGERIQEAIRFEFAAAAA